MYSTIQHPDEYINRKRFCVPSDCVVLKTHLWALLVEVLQLLFLVVQCVMVLQMNFLPLCQIVLQVQGTVLRTATTRIFALVCLDYNRLANFSLNNMVLLPMYDVAKSKAPRSSRRMVLFILVGCVVATLLFLFAWPRGNIVLVANVDSLTPASTLKTLILVPGHAIYLGSKEGPESPKSWILESYQAASNQHLVFISHIERGVELAAQDKNALLLFSGGMTRAASSGITEASGYWRVAFEKNLLLSSEIQKRVSTEDFAKDSFENLVFSVARFFEITNTWPEKIVVVGFEFKRKRWEEIHRKAIKWPKEKFEYVGIDPSDATAVAQAQVGEQANSYQHFLNDLYGCHAPLINKKLSRNPFRRGTPYEVSVPQMRDLIRYCPPKEHGGMMFNGKMPWE